jgi:hypothetical protein
MKCDTCGGPVTVYELFQRSYRLYAYACHQCRTASLTHHFDLDLEIYQIQDLGLRYKGDLVFITGLKAEPRVFDFKVEKGLEAVVVGDRSTALGELAMSEGGWIFAPYSPRVRRRLLRLLGEKEMDDGALSERVGREFEGAK